MSLMVLAICTLPPLAILVVAVTGLCTARFSVALPLIVSAGVLLLPLLSLVFRADEQAPSLRFVSQAQAGLSYASLHPSQ
jgi:hypothetical protein